MAAGYAKSEVARRCAWSSIANSVLLPVTAALNSNVIFWMLVFTNFLLMHAVWLSQVVRNREHVDYSLVRWPLIAFATFGGAALSFWADRLFSVFSQ
jgi:hypothetical protein